MPRGDHPKGRILPPAAERAARGRRRNSDHPKGLMGGLEGDRYIYIYIYFYLILIYRFWDIDIDRYR